MAKKRPEQKAVEPPSFEEALEQIEQIARQLEEGEIGLNDSLEQYEKGVKLLRRCYDLLHRAERRIELLKGVDAEGNPVSTPIREAAPSTDDRVPGRGRSANQSTSPPE